MPNFKLKRLPTLILNSTQNNLSIGTDDNRYKFKAFSDTEKPITLSIKNTVRKLHHTTKSLIPISQAAQMLHVNPDTLRNWERQGRLIPNRTPGGARRYNLFELEEMQKQMNIKFTPKAEPQPSGLPVSQAAKLLMVSPDTIRNWDKKGLLSSSRTSGGARRFSKKVILRLQQEISMPDTPKKEIHSDHQVSNNSSSQLLSILVVIILISFLLTGALLGFYLGNQIINGIDRVNKNTYSLNQNIEGLKQQLASMTDAIGEAQQLSSKIELLSASTAEQINSKADVLGESISRQEVIWLKGDTIIEGVLTAPNVVYGLVAGDNVSISSGQTPKITFKMPDFVNSLQGVTGNVNLISGTDINISGLTINSSSTLASVRNRGGCDNCLSDSDIQDNLTIASGGNISALAIKSDQIGVKYGGTGLFAFAPGDLIYAAANDTLAALKIGIPGSVLIVDPIGVPAWTSKLTVDEQSGNAEIAGGNLIINQGALCVGLDATTCQKTLDAGTIYASTASVQSADLAEKYFSPEQLESGDVVTIASDQTIIKMKGDSSVNPVGVVSTNPGLILNSGIGNGYPVALSGRVPVKVTINNGIIKAGDYLTASQIPGVAAKAIRSGMVIGRAMEDFSCPDQITECTGKIMMFVSLGFADPKGSLARLTIDNNGNLIIPEITINKAILSNDISQVDTLKQKNNQPETSDSKNLAVKLADLQASFAALQQQVSSLSAQIAAGNTVKNKPDLTPAEILLTDFVPPADFNTPTEATLAGQLINYESGTFSKTLKSLGETLVGPLIAAGDIVQDGTLSLSEGNTINALPVLYIQKSNLANSLDIFNGAVTINKQGELKAQIVNVTELRVTGNKISGTAKIVSGQKSVEVTSPAVATNSRILITPTNETDIVLAVTSKDNGLKFTVAATKNVPSDLNFDWWLINETN